MTVANCERTVISREGDGNQNNIYIYRYARRLILKYFSVPHERVLLCEKNLHK